MPENQQYLGDGVYVKSEGYGVWLLANSHDQPTDRIYLEPGVLESLNEFVKRLEADNAQAAEYDNAEHDNVSDNVEY